MKIRNGFVTNSSSSSFIVAFNELPESAEDVQRILFGDQKTKSIYGSSATCKEISEVVWKDMATKASEEEYLDYNHINMWEIAKELSYGSIDGAPELYYHRPGESHTSYGSDPTYNEKYRLEEREECTREDGSKYSYEKADYKLWEKDCRDWAWKKAEELTEKFPEDWFFKFDYGDECGHLGCIMEHSDIFKKLGKDKVIRISKH